MIGLAAMALGGCVRRSIEVTSEPAGAMVWLNNEQVGRTPCETDFKFYGTYDVRVVLEGYEPIATSRVAETPLYEQPGPDLLVAALPLNNRITWHFDLKPAAETVNKLQAEKDVVGRARELRSKAAAGAPQGASTEGTPAGKGDTPAPSGGR